MGKGDKNKLSFHNSAKGLVFIPIACGLPLTLLIPHSDNINVELLTFADIVLWPSIFYSICILFTKLLLKNNKTPNCSASRTQEPQT